MQRTIFFTLLFATLAGLGIAGSSWVAYERVRSALDRDFERRLTRVAMTAASQITPDLVAEARAGGEESYLPVQVQLVTLRTATGIDNASLIDTTRITLVDARAPEDAEGQPSALDTVAHAALREALAGTPRVTTSFARGGRMLRAGLAPIFAASSGVAGGGVANSGGAGGRVAGVVAVEAEPAYLVTLSGLSRTLWLIAALSLLGLAVLASLMVRTTVSAARLERRLSRSENLAAMGRLTATLAHEIKNPLAIIRGSAERLRSRDPEAERMAGFVIEETDRLSRTVARYLQFARGQDSLNERGDAIQALDATLDLLEGEFQARRVHVERSRATADSVTVPLDSESLKQVFLNLVLNALEAMPEGGRLRVTAREPGSRIEVAFEDDGPGIAPDVLKKLGNPFFTTKAAGTGLGLFLARRLLQASGGDLTIRSEVGRGTTCIVRLPRLRA